MYFSWPSGASETKVSYKVSIGLMERLHVREIRRKIMFLVRSLALAPGSDSGAGAELSIVPSYPFPPLVARSKMTEPFRGGASKRPPPLR
jgi:hypothetical protein